MTSYPLEQPLVAATALRSVNFFNGRLLTGDDMRLEQDTVAARLARLGRLLGSGVAYGFEVAVSPASTTTSPVVTVQAGLALAPSGVSLELAGAVDLSLYSTDPATQAGPGGLFADCQPAASGTYTSGSGVYVLVVGPAQQPEGLAQVSGLGNQAASCNVARSAEALTFRLIRLSISPDLVADTVFLRNRVARMCFGYDELSGFLADPFAGSLGTYGLVDLLRNQLLSVDEVPLATIGWSVDTGIEFVDMWSVRRRLVRPTPEGAWGPMASDRRVAEAEAMFLQFEGHIGDLVSGPSPEQLSLMASFEYVPPVGVVPIANGVHVGVDVATFFGGLTVRHPPSPYLIEAAKVEALVRSALPHAPIHVNSSVPIWLYAIREGLLGTAPGGCVLFTSAFVPYAGNPQFGLAGWDCANYALHAN